MKSMQFEDINNERWSSKGNSIMQRFRMCHNLLFKKDDLIKMQRNNCKLVTFQNTFQIIYKSINIILLKSLFTH